MIGRKKRGIAWPLDRQHRIVAAEGLEAGAGDLQDSRPALQRLHEALHAIVRQTPGGSREDDIVAIEAETDAAGELDLLEYHQGANTQPDRDRELQYHQCGTQAA